MYLLDTNILSPLLTPAPPDLLLNRLANIRKEDLYTSAINRGELLYGLLKARKGRSFFVRMERLLDRVQTLSFDLHCANIYGQLRSDLERKGMMLPDLDLMIACVALENRLILVTRNEKHFLRIPQLTVENWFREL